MEARKLLLLPTVIVGDFFESCHMAEAEDYRYIIETYQAWAGSQPCWKARDVGGVAEWIERLNSPRPHTSDLEFTEFDKKLMHVLGVII